MRAQRHGRIVSAARAGSIASNGNARASPRYRPGVGGLRAIPVLALLLHDPETGAFTGDFIGAGTCCVTPDFLISSVVTTVTNEHLFNLWAFHQRPTDLAPSGSGD